MTQPGADFQDGLLTVRPRHVRTRPALPMPGCHTSPLSRSSSSRIKYERQLSFLSPISSDSLTGVTSSTPMAPSSPYNPRMSSSSQRLPTLVAQNTCSSSKTLSAQMVSRRFLSRIMTRHQRGRSLVVLVWSICMSGIRIRMGSTAATLLSGPISIRH